jgi:hypothetical protein
MGNATTYGKKEYIMKLSDKNKLGEGPYSTVYKVTSKDKQAVYAAKIYYFPFELMEVMKQLDTDR